MGTSEAAIWTRVIRREGPMSRETARAILKLSLSQEDKDRMRRLAEKSKNSRISADEEGELDNYCRVGRLLSILKSRARRTIKNNSNSE